MFQLLVCLAIASTALAATDPLLDSLDLSRPELAQVKSAYERSDIPAARKSLADYFRSRKFPKWRIDPDNPPKTLTAKEKTEADDALAHKLHTEVNFPFTWQYSGEIDWHLDPTTRPTWPMGQTAEWTWSLSRHKHWLSLSRAYTATGDARYAVELSHEIESWIRAAPFTPATRSEREGLLWRGIEAGFRISLTWPEAYYRLLHHPDVFPDDTLLAMINSIREHGENLDARTSFGIHTNHLAIECYGLYAVGALFPEFKKSQLWRDRGMQREWEEVQIEVYPDGVQYELAPGYHLFALESFIGVLELARLNSYPIPEGYKPALEKMHDALIWSMSPAGYCPPFNDSDAEDILPALRVGAGLFPQRNDWKWFISHGAAGHAPAETSHTLGYAGWAIMRSDWSKDARYLIMECGPYGRSHQHEDKLSFLLNACGAQLVGEGGIHTYDASDMRDYVVSARAHNVITIDSLEQNRRGGPRDYFVSKKPVDMNWRSTPVYDYAEGSYGGEDDERWGNDRRKGFVQTRRVLFVKPQYWIVLDTVVPQDDAEHSYESMFHLDARKAEVDPTTHAVRTLNRGANLTIFPLSNSDLSVHVVTGQTEPLVQGWIGRTEEEQVPAATPYFTTRCKGPAQFLYVFAPSSAGGESLVKSIKAASDAGAAIAADLELRRGATAHIALSIDNVVTFAHGNDEPIRIPSAQH